MVVEVVEVVACRSTRRTLRRQLGDGIGIIIAPEYGASCAEGADHSCHFFGEAQKVEGLLALGISITMPPRLGSLLAVSLSAPQSAGFISPFLLPCLQSQQRAASILSSLSDNPGAYNKKIRRGRGPASGKGKTSGRGHGGQKQHGKVPRGFNGGQTPDEVVHGIRGFVNVYVHILHTPYEARRHPKLTCGILAFRLI